ncbi:hypothetical protein ABGN05_00285 [Aquibium sp. LZ166]|uniref:CTP synthetase n=1 Tax=Aquibium pacificus TaxID=3153579 RepID=A0ABV3SC07_9HYPH
MLKLPLVIYVLVAPVLMGVFLTALLTMDLHRFDATTMITAVAAGALVAIPVAWIVSRKIEGLR